jgi:hypothetical protein
MKRTRLKGQCHEIFRLRFFLIIQLLFRTKRSRDRNVVLVKRTVDLGCWEFGMGWGWGGDEEGEVSLRATWDGGGQGRITPKEGFQVSKRGIKKGS